VSRKRHPRRNNIHHRLQRKDGGTNEDSNLITVNSRVHNFYHAFFQEGTFPPDMAKKLNEWIRPDYVMIALPKEDARKILKHLSQLVH
jgi:hypothetical protein